MLVDWSYIVLPLNGKSRTRLSLTAASGCDHMWTCDSRSSVEWFQRSSDHLRSSAIVCEPGLSSVYDIWFGPHPHQISQGRNLALIILSCCSSNTLRMFITCVTEASCLDRWVDYKLRRTGSSLLLPRPGHWCGRIRHALQFVSGRRWHAESLRYNYNKYICEHDVFHQLKRFARRQKITVFSTRVVRKVFSLYIFSWVQVINI